MSNTDHRTLLEALRRINPEALLLEPRAVYDRAVVGITCRPDDGHTFGIHEIDRLGERDGQWVAVYSRERAIEAMVEAETSFDFATGAGSDAVWLTPWTPGQRPGPPDWHQTAGEWIDYNAIGSWLGPHTPAWVCEDA